MSKAILRGLKIARVALVDNGANFDKETGDGAHIMLFKSAPKPENKEPDVKKSVIQRIIGALKTTDVTKRDAELEAIEKEFPDQDENVHKAGDSMCKCADCMAKRAPMPEVEKRFSDMEKAHATEREALKKRLDDAEAVIKVERDNRMNGEILTVLKGFKKTSVNFDTDVAHFRKMRDTDPAMYERTIAIMKAAEDQLVSSAAYQDFGTRRGTGEGSAHGQLVAKAEQLMEKSKEKMSKEQAFDKVCLDNPKLVAAYRAELQ